MAARGSPAPCLLSTVLLCVECLCQPTPLTLWELPLWYTQFLSFSQLSFQSLRKPQIKSLPVKGRPPQLEVRTMMGENTVFPPIRIDFSTEGNRCHIVPFRAALSGPIKKPGADSAQGQVCHQIQRNVDKGPILQAGPQACISGMMKEPT